MVDAYADKIAAGFGDAIANLKFKPRAIASARDAAMAVMDLMNFCHNTLPPESICQVYNQARPGANTSATEEPTGSGRSLGPLWPSDDRSHCRRRRHPRRDLAGSVDLGRKARHYALAGNRL